MTEHFDHTPISKLHALGQSIWYDNIQRQLLESGELAGMISRDEIRGVTSNPSIFQSAIAKTHDYDSAIVPMAWSGWTPEDIFYQLAFEDIRAAADLFRPLYEKTNGGDGYVSLEVSPFLAHDTEGTVKEAKRLWKAVDRPNLMVKIPATVEGIPAICETIASGINVNVTLIFSLSRYAQVIDAYVSGLEERDRQGLSISSIASVASFFVSRVDTKVDALLQKIISERESGTVYAKALLGKAAIANARLAYEQFCFTFSAERFQKLSQKGAQRQRPLWASTSTKNLSYRDVRYVEELIGPDTVDTVPPQTLVSFMEHGKPRASLSEGIDEARTDLEGLSEVGIDLEKVTEELEQEGVKAFSDSFSILLHTIDGRKQTALSALGPLQAPVKARIAQMEIDKVVSRLYQHDPTLWTDEPDGKVEVLKRLGWLDLPESSRALIPALQEFHNECLQAGFTHALLLGMGGSSLAPEVLKMVFDHESPKPEGLDLAILDSTDPEQVRTAARRSPVKRTLYIVASKSGSTSEINAFLDFFWARAEHILGKENAGNHFIAITDPGTSLEKLARDRHFRRVFSADPNVGGRYSALTAFGLVPAALLGVDPESLLSASRKMATECAVNIPTGRNQGAVLGAIIGEAALSSRNKLSIIADQPVLSFGSWLEQLVAESSGKNGKGIVPVDGEPVGPARVYANDRLFIYLRWDGHYDNDVAQLQTAGHPVIALPVTDGYDLGSEFFRWEVAVAVACSILGVNGFDQPDVQDSKNRTAAKIVVYKQTGDLGEGQPAWVKDGVKVFGGTSGQFDSFDSIDQIIKLFISLARRGDYIALNAYVPRNRINVAQLTRIRKKIRELTGLATTVGFGPRFLHSTGQLHKGGSNNGLFIQFTGNALHDLPIPGKGFTFSTLERAQSLGDMEALVARNRRTLRIHLDGKKLNDIL